MKSNRKSILFLLLPALLLFSLTACGQGDAAPAETASAGQAEAPLQTEAPAPLTLSETSVFLRSGETVQLGANRDDAVYTVADEAVATVDSGGKLTAVAHGLTYVTVSSQGETASCGVLVDVLGNDAYVDISGKTMEPVIYEREMIKWTILQNWDYVSETGDYYFIQQYDTTPSDDIVTRLQPDGTETYMRLLNAGHGNIISAEYADDGNVYLWANAYGDISGSHSGFMRVRWEDGGVVDNDCENIWELDGMTYYPYAVVDEDSRLALVYSRPGTKMVFRIYDLDSMLSGEPVLLTEFQLARGTADGEAGYQSFQGLCIFEDYIYMLEGGPGTNIYISVYDFSGELVSMELVNGYETISYREPEGLQIIDGELYVGIGSGESGNRRANIFVLR